jgi:phage-related minor tail protein
MTPEECWQRHAEWLWEHDKAIAEIDARIKNIVQIQESTAKVALDLNERLNRLTERIDRYIDGLGDGRQ